MSNSTDSNIRYIRASAGSGKTYTLSTAYLSLLLKTQGLQAGNILATTFTRAAAGEILERVLQRLAQAVLEPEQARQLLLESDLPDAAPALCAETLQTLSKQLHQIGISTIDAFFARVARGMPEQLGLNPNWQIVSESVTDELKSKAVLELFENKSEAFLECYFYWRQHLRSAVNLEQTRELLEATLFTPLSATASASWRCSDIPVIGENFAQQFLQAIRTKNWKKSNGESATDKRLAPAIEKMRETCRADLKLHKAWFELTLLRRYLEGENSYYRMPVPEELEDFIENHVFALRAVCRDLIADQETALAKLKELYKEIRLTLSSTSGSLSFREIEYRVLQAQERTLNTDPETTEDAWSDLYFVLDTQIQHLLFDEFQDTSWSQYRFFQPLIEECASQEERSVVVVGDPKQAIYGWRGGDREVIDRFPKNHLCRIESLDASYRSSPKILEFVDRVFENLETVAGNFKSPFPEAVTDWMGKKNSLLRYQKHTSKREDLQGEVGIWTMDREKETLYAAILKRVQDLLSHPTPPKSIGILLPKNKFIFDTALTLKEAGIDDVAAITSKVTVAASFPVELILATLTLIEHPHPRSAAKLLVAQAPWGASLKNQDTPDSLRKLVKDLRKQRSILGLHGLLMNFYEHETFQNLLTVRDHFLCSQLLKAANQFDKEGSERIDRFIENVRKEAFKITREARIQVMTIHASKGLEFDAVILAGLDAFGSSPSTFQSVSDEKGMQVLVPSPEILGIAAGEEKRNEKFKRKALSEELSRLYVALTRAKSFLQVIVDKEKDSKFKNEKKDLSLRAGLLISSAFETTTSDEDGCIYFSKYEGMAPPKDKVSEKKLPPDTAFSGKEPPTPHLQESFPRLEIASPSLADNEPEASLSKNYFSVETLFQKETLPQQRGIEMHSCLEKISWIEDGLPTAEELLTPTEKRDDNLRFANFLLNEIQSPTGCLHAYFSRKAFQEKWQCPAKDLELWRERSFSMPMDKKLWNGRFDRVVLLRNSQSKEAVFQRAEIIDFKTRSGAKEKSGQNTHDTKQIKIYSKVLSHSLKIHSENIKTSIAEIHPQI
ncbi:MAG: UvrD-helicase domain-containing protein [Chthoniobacterales bacterium]